MGLWLLSASRRPNQGKRRESRAGRCSGQMSVSGVVRRAVSISRESVASLAGLVEPDAEPEQ